MALANETAREIVAIVRKYVDRATLDKIIKDLQEVRGDKSFRDTVEVFVRLSQAE